MPAAKLSPSVPQPAHVPDALAYDFDLFADPAFLADPHARALDLLSSAPPVFWTPRNKGHWVVQTYDAVFDAARDVETFSNEIVPQALINSFLAQLPPGSPHVPQPFPINLDPPEHGKYRKPLQSVFSPKTIEGMKADIRALAVKLIGQLVAQGQCELIAALAEPFPVQVFLNMLGLPVAHMAEYRVLAKEMLSISEDDAERGVAVSMRITASMRETVLARARSPQNDIISLLWQLRIDDRPITLEEVENYGLLLFIAGLDTVTNAIGHGVRHMAANPALQAELRAKPELIRDAAEELLRRYSFVTPKRRLTKDTLFRGAQMKADEYAVLLLPAADLDGKQFPDAEKFNLQRERNNHLVFNAGPHRCLGSHLARVELQIVYEELLARLPAFRLDPDKPSFYRGGHVVALEALHIVWR
jgi:cytochrome P450